MTRKEFEKKYREEKRKRFFAREEYKERANIYAKAREARYSGKKSWRDNGY